MIGDGMEVISDAGSLNDVVKSVYGSAITILEKRPVTGGDINQAYILILSDGQKVFLKENTKDNAGFFKAEADIAMTELFGGFSKDFYFAYRESGLLQQGYEDRRDIYNLYHLLNHLNLFGESYLYAVERVISRF